MLDSPICRTASKTPTAAALERFRLLASGRIGMRTRRSAGLRGEPAGGEPAALGAEDEGVAGPIAGVGVRPRRLGRERPEPVAADRVGGLVERVDDAQVEVLPVVEPRPPAVPVVEPEPQRADQPERRPGGDAGPPDRAGVGRDLGLDQHDVQARSLGIGGNGTDCGIDPFPTGVDSVQYRGSTERPRPTRPTPPPRPPPDRTP